MLRKEIVTTLVVLLSFAGIVRADVVELDLFDLGCPTEFNWDNPYWQTDFDLGVEFVEIDSVYMDWSGEITAGLAILDTNPDEPFPCSVGTYAALGKPLSWRHTGVVSGGGATYPDPEPFDLLSEFVYGDMLWSELFDGKGIITIEYTEPIILDGMFIEHGFIVLNSASLVVEGTIIPEPTTILFIAGGIIGIRVSKRRMLGY